MVQAGLPNLQEITLHIEEKGQWFNIDSANTWKAVDDQEKCLQLNTISILGVHVIVVTQIWVHCLICTNDAQGHTAPRANCGHIRPCTSSNMVVAQVPVLQLPCYTSGTLKICPNWLLTALPIYIAKDSHCDYGLLILTFPWHLFIQYILLISIMEGY